MVYWRKNRETPERRSCVRKNIGKTIEKWKLAKRKSFSDGGIFLVPTPNCAKKIVLWTDTMRYREKRTGATFDSKKRSYEKESPFIESPNAMEMMSKINHLSEKKKEGPLSARREYVFWPWSRFRVRCTAADEKSSEAITVMGKRVGHGWSLLSVDRLSYDPEWFTPLYTSASDVGRVRTTFPSPYSRGRTRPKPPTKSIRGLGWSPRNRFLIYWRVTRQFLSGRTNAAKLVTLIYALIHLPVIALFLSVLFHPPSVPRLYRGVPFDILIRKVSALYWSSIKNSQSHLFPPLKSPFRARIPKERREKRFLKAKEHQFLYTFI